jgi:hypothetical protein
MISVCCAVFFSLHFFFRLPFPPDSARLYLLALHSRSFFFFSAALSTLFAFRLPSWRFFLCAASARSLFICLNGKCCFVWLFFALSRFDELRAGNCCVECATRISLHVSLSDFESTNRGRRCRMIFQLI